MREGDKGLPHEKTRLSRIQPLASKLTERVVARTL